jgi:hypothetical protein
VSDTHREASTTQHTSTHAHKHAVARMKRNICFRFFLREARWGEGGNAAPMIKEGDETLP